jgi:hypothetical protein
MLQEDGFRVEGNPYPGGSMQKRTLLFGLTVMGIVLSTGGWSEAQQPGSREARRLRATEPVALYDDSAGPTSQDIDLLKKDLRSQKKQIVAANMDLSDTEAEKFWPVYDRYAAETSKIYDTKLALFGEYLQNRDAMTGDQAENYLRRRAAVDQDAMALKVKYVPEFRKVLSGRQTALFYQIEWRLDLMINLQLAQAPLIEP